MERIWNKSELEKMDEWSVSSYGSWFNDDCDHVICEYMVGKSVEWCKDNTYIVEDEMIAKTELVIEPIKDLDYWKNNAEEDYLKVPISVLKYITALEMAIERKKIQEALDQASDKLTERLDKGEIGITLGNGTVLKVGEKVTQLSWDNDQFIDIIFIGKRFFVGLDNDGDENSYFIIEDWIPYTEPKEEQKPLEGYQKFYVLCKQGDSDFIDVVWAKSKDEAYYAFVDVIKIYSEAEATNLGLKI